MQYQTLVFDLDGTLSDPALGIIRCMNHALEQHGLATRSVAEITACIGPPLEQSMRQFSGSEDERFIRQLVETYRQRYGELGYAENRLYEQIPQTLSQLADTGICMGVCTSKKQEYAVKVLENFGLARFFSFISGPQYGMAKTEQLAGLLEAGTVTRPALMIGDRWLDLVAARHNGLDAAGVLWGFGDEAELRAQAPRYLWHQPPQMLDLL